MGGMGAPASSDQVAHLGGHDGVAGGVVGAGAQGLGRGHSGEVAAADTEL
jgi:hypothetical protein